MFACCQLVFGRSKSLVYDLQRKGFYSLSNDAYSILKMSENLDIASIKAFYNDKDSFIDDFFNQFIEAEMGFYTNEPTSFPNIDFTWYSPNVITNSIIEIDNYSQFDFEYAIKQLDDLACKAVQIRFLNFITIDVINGYLSVFKTSRIKHIELLIPFVSESFRNEYYEIMVNDPRLYRIMVYSSPKDQLIFSNRIQGKALIEFEKDIRININETIKLERFSTNIELFSEAQAYNLGLNRKVCINKEGEIKNYLTHKSSFGNIMNTDVKNVIESKEFIKKWDVSNDDIEICKDCQYRYTCVSNSDIIEIKGKYYKEEICGFDPFTNNWAIVN